ncbi:4Fe-4S dicluster domain-containing protein [Chloroflexota bacterium]
MELSRKDFLKLSIPATGSLILGGGMLMNPKLVQAASASSSKMDELALLYDSSKCTGCRACEAACRRANELPPEHKPSDLSATSWTCIKSVELDNDGEKEQVFLKRQCMHCTDAACVRACPNGTLYHNEYGFVAYNRETCTGCGYCTDACPFNVPRLDGNSFMGVNKMSKCTMCTTPGLDRISDGLEPSCVNTCPYGALQYGDRSELITAANQRVQVLKADGKSGANLYGENELNGLHTMYILQDTPEIYGLPDNAKISFATTAWKNVLQPVGWVFGGIIVVALGINYIVARANSNKEAK